MLDLPPDQGSDTTLALESPPPGRDDPTDEELLRRYRRSRAPGDLAEIAERHRAMVFRASLRLLGNAHDAEDATQAVFLALARRPEVVRRSLAGGLHALTRAAASELFRSRRRRARREGEAARRGELDGAGRAAPSEPREIREELDVALAKLPANLRQAVILRHLEGLGQEEAARRAGCTPDAMGWRAMKGLDRLRAILDRRGVGTAGGALAGALAAEAGAGATQAAAVAATAKVATAHAAHALVWRSILAVLGQQAAAVLAILAPVAVVTAEIRSRPAAPPPPPVVAAPAPPVVAAPTGLGLFSRTLDVGAPGRAGEVRFADGRYTVRGGGARIYLDRDHFRFVARPWDGDGTITARVSFDPDQEGRQVAAGVMFRATEDAASHHVALMVTGVETRATVRTAKTQPNSHVLIDDVPARGAQWVRLARRGDRFTLAVRSEALPDWKVVREEEIPLARSLLVGLAVVANDDGQLSTAEFDQVALAAGVPDESAPPGP